MIDVRDNAGVEDPVPIPVDRIFAHSHRLVQASLVQVDSGSERIKIQSPRSLRKPHQWAFCAPRAINSSTLERNNFKVGDVFDLL